MPRNRPHVSASIPAVKRLEVNAALAPHAGPDTFSIPLLNPGGRITRYGTSWQMDGVAKGILQALMDAPGNSGDARENEHIDDHAARHGLERKRRGKP